MPLPVKMCLDFILLLFVTIALAGCVEGGSENEDDGIGAVGANAPAVGASGGDLPPVRVRPSLLDYGRVAPSTTVTGTVILSNFSDRAVRILSAQPSCKCTVISEINGTVIPPKGSIELEAALETQGTAGGKSSNIKVLFEGYSKVLTIPLKAEVSRAVRVTPPYINAVADSSGKPSGKERGILTVDSTDLKPFNVISVQGRPPAFVGVVGDGSGAATTHQIGYDLDEHYDAEGRLPRFMVLETDHPDAPLVEVLIRHKASNLQLNRNFKLTDYKMNLGQCAPGGSVRHDVVIHEATTVGDLVIATPDSPFVTIAVAGQSVDDETDDLTATLEFTFSPDVPDGLRYFQVRLFSSSQFELSVPAFVSIRR